MSNYSRRKENSDLATLAMTSSLAETKQLCVGNSFNHLTSHLRNDVGSQSYVLARHRYRLSYSFLVFEKQLQLASYLYIFQFKRLNRMENIC